MRLALSIDRLGGFYAGVLRGIALYVQRQRGWHVDQDHPSRTGIRWLKSRQPDAMILGTTDPRMFDEVGDWRKPLVSVGLARPGTPSLGNDGRAIGELAAKHFIEKRYQHFAYAPRIGLDLDRAKWLQGRLHIRNTSFKEALIGYGYTCHELEDKGAATSSSVWQAELELRFCRWIQDLPKPIAIFCENDELAWRVAQQCSSLGLEIPSDVAILGVDNDPVICELSNPPLSSIELASEQIGYEAAQLVHQLLDKQPVPEHMAFPPLRVFERRSTAAPLVDDDTVAKAMRYMQENLGSEDSVGELSKRVGCSRRSFERRFLQATGSTPARTWYKFRIAEAQRLLSETQLSAEHVAALSGFADAKTLSMCFRKHTGLSPTQFRKRARPNGRAFADSVDRGLLL